jgi:hypothetical protein
MTRWVIAAGIAAGIAGHSAAWAQNATSVGSTPPAAAVGLVDSTGKVAARPFNDTIMLVTVGGGVVAPALIRPIYDPDGRMASGWATWHSGGTVLFTSSDCTAGAHVYSLPHAGVRAAAQVQTTSGIILHVGAIGPATTVAIRSILYDTGCAPVTVRQSGLFPVVTTVNLTTAYPPPLSFQ